ncbi:MAG: glycosyltransferase family A protein [Oscillospiraceae bacterium]|nr:glycosyltransferase family A protein [Oscillospiraceae bacterium]
MGPGKVRLVNRKIRAVHSYCDVPKSAERVLMNNLPTVSVIVPVYNTPGWMLTECLNSIAAQSIPVHELVLVDDGSTLDETAAAISEFKEKYKDMLICLNNAHGGISRALNAGIRAASGDYFCFFASDDYLKTDFIEKLATAAANAGADIVFCGYEYVTHRGERVLYTFPENRIFKETSLSLYAMNGWNFQLYRRRFLIENSCTFPENCIMEDEVFTDFAFTHSHLTVSVPEYLCCVRDRDDSVSRSRRRFNSATVANLPFDEFERCLVQTAHEPLEKREVLAYRIMHSMMACSFLFCCYSEKAERKDVTARAAALVRAHDWREYDFRKIHRDLQDAPSHYLTVAIWRLSLRLRTEQAASSFFCALSRLV